MFFKRKKDKTRVLVQCDAGFPNQLFIRGEGIPGVTWTKGIPLKNVKKDEWVWETDVNFAQGQFKILINDTMYEVGENHYVQTGKTIKIYPKFS